MGQQGGAAGPAVGEVAPPRRAGGTARSRRAGGVAHSRLVVDALTEIVFEIDGGLRFTFLSSSWERVTAIPAERVIGRFATDVVLPAAHAAMSEELGRLVDGDADHVAFEMPCTVDGHPGWLDVRLTARREHDGTFAGAAGLMIDVSARRRNEERLARLALHDALTGLPNRSLLCDRLGQAMGRSRRSQTTVAVLFIDLDHFKLVNDSLGHEAGDELLTTVAKRLNLTVRGSETVARVGGDEFVVVAEGLRDAADALTVATRVQEALRTPVQLAGIEHLLRASIGVVTLAPGEVRPVNDLLAEADMAMYRAKERGRGRVEVFEAELRTRAADRLSTEAALRKALEDHELEVFYQPVVCLETGLVRGAEALMRWRHPDRGLIPPAMFIPTAEENGLIAPMTDLVLTRALEDFAGLGPLGVAVNVSARQLIDPHFPSRVARSLEIAGIDPARVTLEITETAVLSDPLTSTEVLHRLRDQGLTLALDDFGTGYSALTHLQQLPVDCVKIDRSFVDGITRSPKDRALVEAIVGMANALDLHLVAEGIESEEQAAILRELRCPSAQGYLYAAPLPLEDFLAFVAATGRGDHLRRPGWAA